VAPPHIKPFLALALLSASYFQSASFCTLISKILFLAWNIFSTLVEQVASFLLWK